MIPPSELAHVPFVSVENMLRVVTMIGTARMMAEFVDYVEADFRR